jgi:hypothetical protein
MKRNNIFSLLAFLVVIAGGCQKKWLDINTNPNQLPTSTPDFLFTSGANRLAAILDPNELGSYWSGQWTQSSTYIISNTIFAYQFNNTNFNYMDTWYDVLSDFQYVIDHADEKLQSFMKGPSKILKAYIMQQVVDVYGNVPYKEALKGVDILAPKFDDQKVIYDDLIKLLDDAIADLTSYPFQAAGVSADIVFKGSTVAWKRFANSLKLRILIRQSKVSGKSAYIITEINKAAATTEKFLAADQDVTVNPGYLATDGKTNPFYDKWGYAASGTIRALARYPRPTVFLLDVLKASNDTFRMKRLFYASGGENGSNPGVSTKAENVSNYAGVPFGIASGYLSQNTSYIGPSQIVKGQFNRNMILMTAAESFFLLAETKQIYDNAVTLSGTAQSYYEQGVKESFRITGTSSTYGSDKATVLLTSGKDLADWNASPDKLKTIWMQKWLSLVNYGGLEAWSEFRRTNFPVTPLSASASVGQLLPVRLFYPQTEETSNGDNVKLQGVINVFTTKIFWDVD